MSVRISGKNVDLGEALRARVDTRVGDVLDKYFDGAARTGHVTIAKEGSGFRAEAAIHLATGVTLQAAGEAVDAYLAADQLMERIEKRLRRYKRKLRSHHGPTDRNDGVTRPDPPSDTAIYVIAADRDEADVDSQPSAGAAPPVIAETRTRIRTLTVGMAVMELDLSDAPVVVFRNAGHGGLNVVYRRPDGNVGWIDPALDQRAAT